MCTNMVTRLIYQRLVKYILWYIVKDGISNLKFNNNKIIPIANYVLWQNAWPGGYQSHCNAASLKIIHCYNITSDSLIVWIIVYIFFRLVNYEYV